jgi:hypothetical protein
MTDKEIRKKMLEIQTRRIHRCAEYLQEKVYFTKEEYDNTLREFGIARGYFERLYQLDWKYVWIKKCTFTFEEFLRDFCLTSAFRRDTFSVDMYKKQYRLNGDKVEKYVQDWRWRIAFMKKTELT